MGMKMGVQSRWEKYPITYRAEEMKQVAAWIAEGESGAVVGLPGTGRATLLNLLCRRPEIFSIHLESEKPQAVLIPVDLNNLPDDNLATLYRVILRSFYEIRERFDDPIRERVTTVYQKYESARDPFLPQSGLRELLLNFESNDMKVVLVMNRFDRFCKSATPRMTWTLRGLRDSFKETLCYIMGMNQEVTYFSDLDSVAPMHTILDTHVLWVGPLNQDDAVAMIKREVRMELDERAMALLLSLTGGYPSLIRVVCHWWPELNYQKNNFGSQLLARRSVQNRLAALFNALTQEEQSLLRDIANRRNAKGSVLLAKPTRYEKTVLDGLVKKGVCWHSQKKWGLFSQLLEHYPGQAPGQSWGRVWWNEKTAEINQGIKPVELTPLEQSVLEFFVHHPQRRHTYTELIEAAWPGDSSLGVTNEAVQQVIRGIRKKIEPESSKPQYIISWRGQPEGGYQFFPEGRPN
jgi:hypothetical protein